MRSIFHFHSFQLFSLFTYFIISVFAYFITIFLHSSEESIRLQHIVIPKKTKQSIKKGVVDYNSEDSRSFSKQTCYKSVFYPYLISIERPFYLRTYFFIMLIQLKVF